MTAVETTATLSEQQLGLMFQYTTDLSNLEAALTAAKAFGVTELPKGSNWLRLPDGLTVDAEGGVAGGGQLQHLGALAERRDGVALLVGRPGRGDEPDLIQAPLLAGLLGQDEVPEVNRVEGAAEDADTHDRLP